MKTAWGSEFIEHEPTLSSEEVQAAEAAGNVVRGRTGIPLLAADKTINGIVVKFAVANGDAITLILNPVVAMAVHALAENAHKMNWTAAGLVAPPTRH